MEDKFFNVDEMMVDYAEMSGFDFQSGSYLASVEKSNLVEYAHQPYTFKYGNFDVVDMLKSMFTKTSVQKG